MGPSSHVHFDHDYIPGFLVNMDTYSGTDAWHPVGSGGIPRRNRLTFLREETEVKMYHVWIFLGRVF